MNRLNHYPPNPKSCCCYCSFKKDYSPKGFKGANYSESSPSEDNGDEDGCGNRTSRNNDSTFSRDEIYDNLLDMIDDQMISTMSTLRKKARKFMKSEFEQSFSSDSTNYRCNHLESNRSKGTTVVKKANEIDYQPQSMFLKKMVQQYQCRQIDPNESDFSAVVEKSTMSENKDQNVSKPKSPPVGSQKETSSGACCCKCHNSALGKGENSRKSGHVSRSKKKVKCRGNKKRRLGGNCVSGDRIETCLKQPHENSCERCWRFASPSRSPVNKPDQRYDPNFRRGHSCTNLNTEKAADFADEKGTRSSQCKNQSNLDTPEDTKNVWQTLTSTPKSSTPKKLSQIQNAPCDSCSAQFTPFSKKTLSRSHTNKSFDFEYPPLWLSETFRSQQQKCTQKRRSYDKSKERNSLEKGVIYSSKTRNLLTPQSLIPAKCNDSKEQEEYPGSQQYKDSCGKGRLENLDPCTKRNLSTKKEEPCDTADIEMSIMRGENSIENGFSMSKGSVMDTGRNAFDQSGFGDLSEIPIDPLGQIAGEPLDNSDKKSKLGTGKGETSEKPSTANKSPKSKSPKRSPLDRSKTKNGLRGGSKDRNGLRGSKDKNGLRGSKDKKGDSKKGTCSTNEAQAYFKIPSESRSPEECGVSHPIRHCQCYPRVVDKNKEGDIYCCHCGWQGDVKNESRRFSSDEADSPLPNESCCSSRPSFSEPPAFQGRRPSPNRVFNQKPTTLPNIDEYPEQLYDLSMAGADGTEMTVPCPYRMFMSNRPLNDSTNANEPRCQRRNSPSRNGNLTFGDGNVSYRNENTNFSQMSGNENCPRYGNGNTSFGNFTTSSQVNAGSGMEYPRRYCVMYMTKGKDAIGDDVEVLVEELSQPCPYGTDDRMANVKEKMTRMYKCPTESMALRFQKGVFPRTSVPQKSRVLYF